MRSRPVRTTRPGTGDDYTNLIAEFEGPYAYSYTFDGQAGYLDHALASATIGGQVTGAAEWHINSDEPDVLDYDTSFKPPAQEALYEPDQYRTSDHDAVVVGLDLTHVPPVGSDDEYTTAEDTTLRSGRTGSAVERQRRRRAARSRPRSSAVRHTAR